MGESVVHLQCQCCRAPLSVLDWNESEITASQPARPASRHSAVLGASLFGGKVDESFIVLENSGVRRGAGEQTAAGPSGRNLDESFVLLAGASALRSTSAGGLQQSASHSDPTVALDDRFKQLLHVFELASCNTQLDQPLCMECGTRVKEEVEASIAEVEAECSAYEAAIAKLEGDKLQPLSEEAFQAELQTLGVEDAEMQAQQAEAALKRAQHDLDDLQAQAEELAGQEEQYWHGFNEFQMQLASHVEERDALLNKIDATTAQLERLRRANVYNDVFHIWHDGPFGTISGFRLGRTPACPVSWDEINAAWGQAVLLLHTMAQACRLQFSSYRLLPMGSYPRISDRRITNDLFGPVNRLYCPAYDRAATYFLACLKEFSEVARSRDLSESRPPFELPYAIEGDCVGGHTIRLQSPFRRDEKWTKALKYMLTDLKWALTWMISRQDSPLPPAGPLAEPAT